MIELRDVTKRYANGKTAVDGLSLDVGEGEICVLVGPSGCGKTTTMKMINRLIEPTSGQILIGGDDVTRGDPVRLRRGIGYVIQQIGLFPHMSIADNVGTVPRLLGWDRGRIHGRVDELLELVGLPPGEFRDRYPDELSGGQRQRVGVARALGADPPVLLMDEPFGAIDPITRDRLQNEFLRLQDEVKKTIVFVTHDVDEAVKIGDRIAVLRQGGHLEQYDTPTRLLAAPASDFVAEFVGADRALKRLSVMRIDPDRLEHPPTVPTSASLADTRTAMDTAGAGWAVVLDDAGRPRGRVCRDEANGDGVAGDRAENGVAAVPSEATLRQALSELLLHDSGWVAVIDGDRYIGALTPAALHALGRAPDTDGAVE